MAITIEGGITIGPGITMSDSGGGGGYNNNMISIERLL